MRRVLLSLALLTVACAEEPVFEPDGLHFELLRQWDAETGGLREGLEPEWVCFAPTRPTCYCEPTEPERLLGGLSDYQRLDVNRASAEELESLPGIGPGLAARIVAHRERRPFEVVEELMAVEGIGQGRFRRLKPLVTVGPVDLRGER